MGRIARGLVKVLDGSIGAPVILRVRRGVNLHAEPIRAREQLRGLLSLPKGPKVRVMPRFGMAATFLTTDVVDRVARSEHVEAVFLDKEVRIPEVAYGASWQSLITPLGRPRLFDFGLGGSLGLGGGEDGWPKRRGVGLTTRQALDLLGVPAARAQGLRGEGIRIANIDSDASRRLLQHPQLSGRGIDRHLVNPAAQSDTNGHGAFTATTAFGSPWTTRDGIVVEGVAPKAKALLVKALHTPLGIGSESDILIGLEEATRWAQGEPLVVNMSLGVTRSGNPDCACAPGRPEEDALCDAFNSLPRETAILVAASGNDASAVNLPASCRHVLAVAATTPEGKPASFSSRGPEVALAMPGVDLTSGIEEGTLLDAVGKAGFRLSTLSGTSMATPLATGMIALFAQAMWARFNVRITHETVRQALREHGQPHTNELGHGPLTWPLLEAYMAKVAKGGTKVVV